MKNKIEGGVRHLSCVPAEQRAVLYQLSNLQSFNSPPSAFAFYAHSPIILAPMSRASQLLRLQDTDLDLEAARTRLKAIETALGEAPAVRAAQKQLAAAQAQVATARAAVRLVELDVQSLTAKITEVDGRLYGGRVTNPKELQDLQKDIESLKRQHAKLEEQELEILIQQESAETAVRTAEAALQRAEAEAAKTHGSLLDEKNILKTRVGKLEVEREALAAPIPAEDRELYDRLRSSKRGRAVSRLEDGVCATCGVATSSSRGQSARQGNDLIRCGNCERILCAE